MLLRPQSTGHIFTALHDAAALVVKTQHRRHHVRAAFCRFQRRRTFLLIADTTGFAALTCRKSSSDKSLLLHSGLCAKRASHIMQVTDLIPLIGGESHDPVPAGGHSAVDSERSCYIAGQVTVVAVKALNGFIRLRYEGLHLHIVGRHQSTGHTVQVDALVPLVDMKCLQIRRLAVRLHKPRLDLQRTRQFLRQFFAALKSAAQDAHTGCFRQIIF